MFVEGHRPRGAEDEPAFRSPTQSRAAGSRVGAEPAGPSLADEVAYISGIDASGRITSASYWSAYEHISAFKFGPASAGTGATISYAFDPSSGFTTTERATFERALATWSAIADVRFVRSDDTFGASIRLVRGTDGLAYTDGAIAIGSGSTLGHRSGQAVISIDTSVVGFDLSGSLDKIGGYGFATAIHEIGHAIGLGHGGAYNMTADPGTDQFSVYDTTCYSVMSYFNWSDQGLRYGASPGDVRYDWGVTSDGYYRTSPQTAMPADIAAIQGLYGVSRQTPFATPKVFGFHSTVTGPLATVYNFANNPAPVVTLYSSALGNTLDLSGYTAGAHVRLTPGASSDIAGLYGNLTIAAGTWIDNCVGGGGDDWIIGNDHANRIEGGRNDDLEGGGGDDVLIGTTSMLMSGGFGDDRFYLVDGRVYEDEGAGFDRVFCSGAFCSVQGGVEVVTFTSSVDVLGLAGDSGTTIYANSGDDELRGGFGGDTLIGGAGDDQLSGDFGADQLFGGEGADHLIGYVGADTLNGGIGADRMEGGSDDDQYFVDHVGDMVSERRGEGHDLVTAAIAYTLSLEVEDLHLVGGARQGTGNASANAITGTSGDDVLAGLVGDDALFGMAGVDRLDGGAGNDRLVGGNGADQLTGSSGLDTLEGGAGADRMIGGAGSDHYYVDAAGDVVVEESGGGRDLVIASVATTLSANVEDLELVGGARHGTGNASANLITGSAGGDYLAGLEGFDTLYGMAGDDRLDGGAASDILVGGLGADVLTGGAGVDRFVFLADDSGPDAATADRIADFSHAEHDHIDLSGLSAESLIFVGTADFSGVAGEVRYAFSRGSTFVTADLDGDRIADFGLRLTGHVPLAANDLFL